FGLEISEAKELFQKWTQGHFPNVEICGLMGMATFTDNQSVIRREFSTLKQLFDQLSVRHPLQTLSMGMSSDYRLAIECGSNSGPVGSAICGDQEYRNESHWKIFTGSYLPNRNGFCYTSKLNIKIIQSSTYAENPYRRR